MQNIQNPFQQHRRLSISIVLLALLIGCALFSGLISSYNPTWQGDILSDRYLTPSVEHPFGTDKFARDVFSRVLYGGRISLTIGISVCLIMLTVGLIYGTISGYWGGAVDALMMRILDFLLAFPIIFLIIPAVAIFEMNHWYLIPLLGLTGWMEIARLVRAEVLSLRERDFILAVRGLGFSRIRILLRHIIPNCLTPIMVIAPLKIAEVILLESGLSFLGIGVQPPVPSWGNMINEGREVLIQAWWIATFPGFFISLTVLSFNLLGEGLQDRFQVKRS